MSKSCSVECKIKVIIHLQARGAVDQQEVAVVLDVASASLDQLFGALPPTYCVLRCRELGKNLPGDRTCTLPLLPYYTELCQHLGHPVSTVSLDAYASPPLTSGGTSAGGGGDLYVAPVLSTVGAAAIASAVASSLPKSIGGGGSMPTSSSSRLRPRAGSLMHQASHLVLASTKTPSQVQSPSGTPQTHALLAGGAGNTSSPGVTGVHHTNSAAPSPTMLVVAESSSHSTEVLFQNRLMALYNDRLRATVQTVITSIHEEVPTDHILLQLLVDKDTAYFVRTRVAEVIDCQLASSSHQQCQTLMSDVAHHDLEISRLQAALSHLQGQLQHLSLVASSSSSLPPAPGVATTNSRSNSPHRVSCGESSTAGSSSIFNLVLSSGELTSTTSELSRRFSLLQQQNLDVKERNAKLEVELERSQRHFSTQSDVLTRLQHMLTEEIEAAADQLTEEIEAAADQLCLKEQKQLADHERGQRELIMSDQEQTWTHMLAQCKLTEQIEAAADQLCLKVQKQLADHERGQRELIMSDQEQMWTHMLAQCMTSAWNICVWKPAARVGFIIVVLAAASYYCCIGKTRFWAVLTFLLIQAIAVLLFQMWDNCRNKGVVDVVRAYCCCFTTCLLWVCRQIFNGSMQGNTHEEPTCLLWVCRQIFNGSMQGNTHEELSSSTATASKSVESVSNNTISVKHQSQQTVTGNCPPVGSQQPERAKSAKVRCRRTETEQLLAALFNGEKVET